jgi:hypothetical protein
MIFNQTLDSKKTNKSKKKVAVPLGQLFDCPVFCRLFLVRLGWLSQEWCSWLGQN